jgi:hypothetical protein
MRDPIRIQGKKKPKPGTPLPQPADWKEQAIAAQKQGQAIAEKLIHAGYSPLEARDRLVPRHHTLGSVHRKVRDQLLKLVTRIV